MFEAESPREQREAGDGPSMRTIATLVAWGLLAAALVAFVVQNTEKAPIQWVFFESEAPIWVVIVVSFVAGILFSQVGGWFLRRRRSRGDG